MIAAARLDGPIWQRLRSPRTVGTVGLVLGAFAAFLAIPPIEARGVLWPILVGILAAAFGVWTITRGERHRQPRHRGDLRAVGQIVLAP